MCKKSRKESLKELMATHLKKLAKYFGESDAYDQNLSSETESAHSSFVKNFFKKVLLTLELEKDVSKKRRRINPQSAWRTIYNGELVRQTILRQKRAELASAQHLIVNYVPILNHLQLDTITMSLCAHFRVLENFGTNNIPAGLSRVEFFIMQFDAIISGCVDPNNIAEIHAATYFLQAQYEMIRLFHVV